MDSPDARRAESWTGVVLACAVAVLVAVFLLQSWRMQGEARMRAELMTGGDADHGKAAISRDGCGGCHTIPGVAGAHGFVGPSLAHYGQRVIIAGKLSNEPAKLVEWIRNPQSVSPGTDMPDMAVPEHEARDIAAYLYTLQ